MIKFKCNSSGWRPSAEALKGMKVVDIGGYDSYFSGSLDAIIDIRQPRAAAKNYFIGNIDMPEVWKKVLAHVAKHGKWDYAVCTHTLEDICNPYYAALMIEKIAIGGLIIVPSKYREMGRFSGNFRGFIHHKWIFDITDKGLTAYPKINYIEEKRFDSLTKFIPEREELIVEWEESINLKIINDGLPYGTETKSGDDHIRDLYDHLLKTYI